MADAVSISTASTSDPIRDGVLLLLSALNTDFGADRFRQSLGGSFEDQETNLRFWKRRCYAKLRRVESASIVDGYEQCVAERRPYMPNLAELTETIISLDARRKKDQEEIAAVSAPVYTGGMANYVIEVLAPNAETSVAQRELARMRQILARPAGANPERDARLAVNVAAHEALLRNQRERKLLREPQLDRTHLKCAVANCQRVGTLTTSISGSAVWYCPEHYANKQRLAGSL